MKRDTKHQPHPGAHRLLAKETPKTHRPTRMERFLNSLQPTIYCTGNVLENSSVEIRGEKAQDCLFPSYRVHSGRMVLLWSVTQKQLSTFKTLLSPQVLFQLHILFPKNLCLLHSPQAWDRPRRRRSCSCFFSSRAKSNTLCVCMCLCKGIIFLAG